ncbi:MAG: hypothetical protein ACTS46_00305 [Candidatus Hodgkinia cicadicola]
MSAELTKTISLKLKERRELAPSFMFFINLTTLSLVERINRNRSHNIFRSTSSVCLAAGETIFQLLQSFNIFHNQLSF